VLVIVCAITIGSGVVAYRRWGPYGESVQTSPGIHREYDVDGQLKTIVYDAHGRHKPDTWSYFDHGRLLRTEVDTDGDGIIDTWYYYGPDGDVTKTGFSTRHDGVVDGWRFETPAGALVKIEYSAGRDGRVTRTEFYDGNTVTRVAESDGDRVTH
jgi:hypothetical protein